MDISAAQVKELREATGAGILDCRKALQEHHGDFDKAITWLREKGLAAAAKKAGREAKDGVVELYSHGGGRVGVMVEVNCETDFVAKTDDFKSLARDIAMQIAAMNPQFIKREEVPAATVEREMEIYRTQARNEKKPENIVERVASGKLEKFFQDVCLLEQTFIKDAGKTIRDIILEITAKTGEKVTIRRFKRFHLGENG